MHHLHGLALVALAGLTTLSIATDIVYVTDLEIYTLLVCGQSSHETNPSY